MTNHNNVTPDLQKQFAAVTTQQAAMLQKLEQLEQETAAGYQAALQSKEEAIKISKEMLKQGDALLAIREYFHDLVLAAARNEPLPAPPKLEELNLESLAGDVAVYNETLSSTEGRPLVWHVAALRNDLEQVQQYAEQLKALVPADRQPKIPELLTVKNEVTK